MRITRTGQVPIPQVIRETAGLLPHTAVEFEYVRGGARTSSHSIRSCISRRQGIQALSRARRQSPNTPP
jgi:bifunctional DNA-binding transcriptional regulator/antitoxin component of YhaV-PrlF toxin-antitoxin module